MLVNLRFKIFLHFILLYTMTNNVFGDVEHGHYQGFFTFKMAYGCTVYA